MNCEDNLTNRDSFNRNTVKNIKPFVRSRDYFGPDRRRRDNHYSGDDKRKRNPVYLTPPILMEPADRKGKWLDRAF